MAEKTIDYKAENEMLKQQLEATRAQAEKAYAGLRDTENHYRELLDETNKKLGYILKANEIHNSTISILIKGGIK